MSWKNWWFYDQKVGLGQSDPIYHRPIPRCMKGSSDINVATWAWNSGFDQRAAQLSLKLAIKPFDNKIIGARR